MNFKTLYIILLFFCAALVGAGFGFIKVYQQRNEGPTLTLPKAVAFSQVSPEIYEYLEQAQSAVLTLTGSTAFDDSILLNCYDATWNSFSCDSLLDSVADYLSGQSTLIGNVNGTFAGENKTRQCREEFGYIGRSYYNAPDEFAQMLGANGFDLLAMANYHAYDSNLSGLAATRQTILKNGMTPVGIFAEEEQVCAYETIDLGGITAALFSYTEDLKFSPGTQNEFSVNQLPKSQEQSLDELCQAVKRSKKVDGEIAVVYVCFADTRTGTVSTHQRQVTQRLLDAGADIVVGAQSDCIEPMEIRRSGTKKSGYRYQVALYSLGNLITGQTGRVGSVTRNTGMIARFEYGQDSTGTYLSSLSFSPTYCVSYPTVEESEDAGAHVRVFSISDVADYIEQGGSTKSRVTSTRAAVKKDLNGASQRAVEATSEAPAADADSSTQQTTTTAESPATQTTAATEAEAETTTEPAADATTESTGALSRVFQTGVLTVKAAERDDMEDEVYTRNLTRSDFSYLKNAAEAAIDRLFYNTGYDYNYKDGWYTVKKIKK